MEYTDIIYLITKEVEEDDIGNYTSSSIHYNKCYAKRQTVKVNEYYNAVANGKNPSVEFVIKKLNYNNENEVKWNDVVYEVIRTIEPKNKFDIVLVCSKKIGVK